MGSGSPISHLPHWGQYLQPRPLPAQCCPGPLHSQPTLADVRPQVGLLPRAQPYSSPSPATAFLLLLSPSAPLPRGTEVLPTHTLFLYHHSLLPLPSSPCIYFLLLLYLGASLERFGPLGPKPTRRPTFDFGTHEQGLLGRGRRQTTPPPPLSTLASAPAAGSLLPTGD